MPLGTVKPLALFVFLVIAAVIVEPCPVTTVAGAAVTERTRFGVAVTPEPKNEAGGAFVPNQLLIAFIEPPFPVWHPSWLPLATPVAVLPRIRQLLTVVTPVFVKIPPPPKPTALPLELFVMVESEMVAAPPDT